MRRHAVCITLLAIPFCAAAQSVHAIVEGDVVNATTNAAITNARIRLATAQTSFYAKVDSQGHFKIENLSLGSYQLSVESPGFLPSNRTRLSLSAQAAAAQRNLRTAMTIYPGSQVPDAQVTNSIGDDGTIHAMAVVPMLAYSVIAGRVTDPYGLPMKNCSLEVLKKSAPRPTEFEHVNSNSQTDDFGEYRIQLEPGTYWIAVNKGGLSWQTWESADRITYFPAATSLERAKPLEVAAGQTVRADIQIVRQPGVRVSGKLLNPPVDQHSYLQTNLSLMPEGNVLTNANGPFVTGSEDFEFHDVLPGKYILIALTRDLLSDRSGVNQKAVSGLTREVVVGERDMNGFDLALEPLKDLPGEVTFREGCAPTPIDIRAAGFNPVSSSQTAAVSAVNGKFVLSGLMPGKVNINVSWRPIPGQSVQISSIRLGDRDVQKNGFDFPYSGSGMLRVAMSCGGRQQ